MRAKLLILFFLAVGQALELSFQEKGTMPKPRAFVDPAVVGTKIYFFGGMSEALVYVGEADTFSYDTATDTWENLSDGPTRYGMGATTDGEKIWGFGGWSDADTTNYLYGTYDIAKDNWQLQELPQFMFTPAVTYVPNDERVLIVYGHASHYYYPGNNTFEAFESPYSSDNTGANHLEYDNKVWLASSNRDRSAFRTVTLDGKTWTDLADNPDGTTYGQLIRVGDVMLTLGGSLNGLEDGVSLDLISMYNVTSNEWSDLDVKLPVPLSGFVARIVGPNLYMFGGLNNDGVNPSQINDKYWIVPCIDPSVCENGCDKELAQCAAAPVAPPTTPSAPSVPVSNTSPTSTNNQPQSKTAASSRTDPLASIIVALGASLVIFA